jgi:hypothetical protein
MDYKIIKNTENEFFVEVDKDSFRTKIVFDFIADENFKGIAVCCSYNFKGQAVGFLKDNGLIVSKVHGKHNRPIFRIDDTIIQAGPTLLENFEPSKRYQEEGFSSHEILKGTHTHIGQKKFGNYIIGFTKDSTLSEIIKKYQEFNVQNAIKLPGLKQVGFHFKSSHQVISVGSTPMSAALIFESRLKEVTNLNS